MSTLPQRILDRIFVCPFSGCWLWTGGDTGTGRGGNYGKVWHEGRMRSVHRVVFQLLVGEIPFGHDVDHLCARWSGTPDPRINRRCCNPDHLEAVEPLEHYYRRFRG